MGRNKVQLADGTVLMDITGSTVTPGKMLQGTVAYNAMGNQITGSLVIEDVQTVIDALFPVGSVYATTSSTAPTFGGTWSEIKVTRTWNDLKNGESNYAYGTGSGNLHYWKRVS